MRDALAKWGTPPAVAKWAPEELSDGKRGIRWVTEDGIHGRPTDHDVREYLKRTPTAHGCHCDECKQFYTAPQPTHAQAGAVPLTDEQIKDLQDDDVFFGTCRQIVRAIEAEVHKQDNALILMLVERLERADKISGYPNNKAAIAAARARL